MWSGSEANAERLVPNSSLHGRPQNRPPAQKVTGLKSAELEAANNGADSAIFEP